MPVTRDITLSTGAVVRHSRMDNGAQRAEVIGRETGEMTPKEWAEYCRIIRQMP